MRRLILCAAALLLLFSRACAEETLAPAWPVPQYVEWLLETARGELGYTETSSGYTKYGEWAGDPQAEWCAEFLCWCVDQVDQQHGTHLLTTVYPRYSGSNTGRDWFIREGRYVARTGSVPGWGSQWYEGLDERLESGSYIPQPGDWVFYTFDDSGNTAHVAMVEYCSRDGQGAVTVHTIEGNLPDKVQRSSHALTDWRVMGYGTVRDVAGVVMKSGCAGVKVLALQQRLCALGYLDEKNVVGTYGSATAQAVRDFQTATDKVPTGIANRHTQLKIDEMYWQLYWQTDDNFVIHQE